MSLTLRRPSSSSRQRRRVAVRHAALGTRRSGASSAHAAEGCTHFLVILGRMKRVLLLHRHTRSCGEGTGGESPLVFSLLSTADLLHLLEHPAERSAAGMGDPCPLSLSPPPDPLGKSVQPPHEKPQCAGLPAWLCPSPSCSQHPL